MRRIPSAHTTHTTHTQHKTSHTQTGICNNLREILGESPDEWLWPPLRPTPGGTAFRSVFDPDVVLPPYKL